MENSRIPFVNLAEHLRENCAGNYFCNLSKRLQELNQQKDSILKRSVKILRDINEAAINLDMVEFNLKNELEKLANKSTIEKMFLATTDSKDQNVLEESLIVLKRTKGSLERFEEFLNDVVGELSTREGESFDSEEADNYQVSKSPKPMSRCKSLEAELSSCSISDISLWSNKSKDFMFDVKLSATDCGYQGDIEPSEYDLLSADKRKKHNF